MFFKKGKNSEPDSIMLANDRIDAIELDMTEIKSSFTKLDQEVSQDIRLLKDEIKDLRDSVKTLKSKANVFDHAIRENIQAETREVSKIKLTSSSVSEFRTEIGKMQNELKRMGSEISRLDGKEISIQYDKGLEKLREDFDKFRKKALTIDDRI
ncbi:MAG: hypothetical protein KAI51_03210 [Candidatus Aenigmarchaeota archaeon]|nr:hypothetical protein [Candidatus Aenigmarchaeota archaeon]MCK5452420.1 hypothetical protein [Candidatus Aenigmarchaeota archaeon]